MAKKPTSARSLRTAFTDSAARPTTISSTARPSSRPSAWARSTETPPASPVTASRWARTGLPALIEARSRPSGANAAARAPEAIGMRTSVTAGPDGRPGRILIRARSGHPMTGHPSTDPRRDVNWAAGRRPVSRHRRVCLKRRPGPSGPGDAGFLQEARSLYREVVMSIEGKSVLVTGANRGIGQALVTEALRRGASRVYAGTRQPLAYADERVT